MQYKTLDSLCKVASGGTPSRSKKEYWDGGDIPWIKIGNIKSKVVSNADEYITEAGLNNSSAKLFKKGTILYTIFATLGEVGILDFDACTNQAIAGISIEKPEEITTDYLYYYLKSKKAEVNQIGRGVAQNNINLSILRKFSIPLRDIEDQKTIVGSLNKVESIIEKQKQQLERLDELIKARFVEMFSESKCGTKKLNEITDIITKGTTPTTAGFEFTDSGINFFKIESITEDHTINLNKVAHVSEECHKTLRRSQLREGDVLFSIAGAIGRTAIISKGDLPGNTNQALAIIRLSNDSGISQKYLISALDSPEVFEQCRTQKRGVAQINLSLQDVGNIEIPIPSPMKQKTFELFAKQVDKSKFAVQKSLEKTQLLFDSLMQEYFG